MTRTLSEVKAAQQNLNDFRGSEINRNYWKGVLAYSFPKIIEEKNGVPIVIEFMGNRYLVESI